MSGRSVHKDSCKDRFGHREERWNLEAALKMGTGAGVLNFECCGNGCCEGYWRVMRCGCLFIAEGRKAS
jgi:hypothetical protein